MTKNQENLIRFIAKYRVKYGVSPTLKEMVAGIHVSDHKSVSNIISALIKQGYLERGMQKVRSILLTDKAFEFLEVPLFHRQQIEKFDFSDREMSPTSSGDITYLASNYFAHGKQTLKNNGTNQPNDLKTIIGNTANNIALNVVNHEKTAVIFCWALLITVLVWVNIMIVKDVNTSLIYAVIVALVIKNLLIK